MSDALDKFRRCYELQLPQIPVTDPEKVKVNASDGLRLLQPAPVTNVSYGRPPYSHQEQPINKYLWVIDLSGIPYIFEERIDSLCNAKPKHTNLTGGGAAYLGGELWFASDVSIYINGGSGRYPPKCEAQLKKAASVFESFGYEVICLGWDGNAAKRFLEVTR